MFKLSTLMILSIILISFHSLNADIQWKHTGGPLGGFIKKIEISQNGNLFAVSLNATYKSTDNGLNWRKIQMNGLIVENISFNSTGSAFIITSLENNKNEIYRSNDELATVNLKNTGLENRNIYNIYFQSNNDILACTDDGIYQSTNNGDSWSFLYRINIASNKIIQFLKFGNNNIIYAGTLNGLYSSSDNGSTWQFIYQGENDMDRNIENLVINNQGEIFISTPSGIRRSINNGVNWDKLSNGIEQGNIRSLIVANNQELVASAFNGGTYHSTDNGNSWIKICDDTGNDIKILNDGKIFIATTKGVLFNESYSGTWSFRNTGISEVSIFSILINKFENAHHGEILTGDNNGAIHRSTDNGDSWTNVFQTQGATVSNMIYDKNKNIFAATLWGGIYKSMDDGITWESKSVGLNDPDVRSIVVDSNGNLFAGTFSEIYKSTDDGNTWISCFSKQQSLQCSTLVVNKNNIIFAGTIQYGMYHSTDNGEHWIQNANDLKQSIHYLTINKNNELLAITETGNLYISTNDGENWTVLKSGMDITNILCINNDDYIVSVLSAENNGTYRTLDKGSNWTPQKSGITVPTYQIDINSEGILFVATDQGIYRSVSPVSNVEENIVSNQKIFLYPNPTSMELNIDGLETDSEIFIYNLYGIEISNSLFLSNTSTIYKFEVSNLQSGNYFVKIKNRNNVFFKEFSIIK